MMLRRSWLLLSFIISWSFSFGQMAESSNDSAFKTIQLPMFDLGFGWSFLMGDIGNASPAPSPALQLSYGLSIRQAIMPYLSVSIDFSSGKFYGEKALSDSGNINYQTSVINQGLRFTYEASHLFRKNDKGFARYQPYLGVGIGLISFRAKGDLKDENQNTYNYWSDGTIRSLPESSSNVDLAEVISRDMVYESDLRDANLDGFGRYDQMALRVPIELGFRYQFTKRIGAHIKGVYNLNFTDLLDNVTSESLGDRKGNTANDNHLSAMVGVSVYLGEYRKPKRKKKKRDPKPDLLAEDDSNDLDKNKDAEATQDSTSTNISAENENLASDIEEDAIESDLSAQTDTEIKIDSLSDEGELSQSSSLTDKDAEADLEDSEEADSKTNTTNEESEGEVSESDNETLVNTEKVTTTSIEEYKLIETRNDPLNPNSGQSNNAKDQNNTAIVSNTAKESIGSDTTELSEVGDSNATNGNKSTSTSSEDNSVESAESQPDKLSENNKEVNEMSTMDLIDKTMDIESTEPKIAGSYHWADVNKDKYISADEVLHFIDLLFDGESKYTVPMIHELIEYYFDQD